MSHGSRSFIVPSRSELNHGFFGRIFRSLPPHNPRGGSDSAKINELKSIADQMVEDQNLPQEDFDNTAIPAGYTYFGQFVDHDITFDPRSSLTRLNDPDMLENFRTPRFDLDSIYGRGPEDQPYLYSDGIRIQTGQNANGDEDLQRNANGRAMIGDHRNDENVLVGQMQLAFIKFHNAVVDDLDANYSNLNGHALFAEAQRIVRWHYQYVVIHDYLKRLCGVSLVDNKLPDQSNQHQVSKEVRLLFYDITDRVFMPVEFSVAAFRLGHTMVRNAYVLNDVLGNETPIFDGSGNSNDLRGFGPLPSRHTVQWDKFLDFAPMSTDTPQFSRKLDEKLSLALSNLPTRVFGESSLASLNLQRGFRMGLPSGQDVARTMGIVPIDSSSSDPLWFYILKESNDKENGVRLGPVGAHIVSEVFVGMLAADACSYLNVNPRWTPAQETMINIPLVDPIIGFQLRDIIKFAGMPITAI